MALLFDLAEQWARDNPRGCAFVNAWAELSPTNHPALAVIRAERAWMRQLFARLFGEVELAADLHLLYEGAQTVATTLHDDRTFGRARRAESRSQEVSPDASLGRWPRDHADVRTLRVPAWLGWCWGAWRYRRDVAALVIVVVVLSGALGLGQRRLATRVHTEGQDSAEGIPLTDLLAPVRILVALVLAFVLVQTFSSYEDASDAADDEAGAVSTEAVAAALLPSPTGPDLVAQLRCYARAVAGPGWTSLEATRRTSMISRDADARVAAAVAQAQQADISETLVAEVVAAERGRAAARRVRLAEAAPSVPALVTALLIGCVAITVASTAAFADRRIRPSLRWTLLGVTTLIFTASLLVILDLDRPFGGVARIDPTSMRAVEEQIGATSFGGNPPCDQSGAPLAGS